MFVRTVLHDYVKLKANEIGRNFKDVLTVKIKDMVEAKCTRYGYIVPGSVAFLNCSCGRLDGASLNGDVVYEVEYQATVCNPADNSVVQAKVVNVNRFGILAHGGLLTPSADVEEANLQDGAEAVANVLEIIVAKQGVALASEVDLDKIKIGDAVQVQILGKRFELNDVKISVVGKILGTSAAPVAPPAAGEGHLQHVAGVGVDDHDDDAGTERDSADLVDTEELESDQEDGSEDTEAEEEEEEDELDDADDAEDDEDDTFLSDVGDGSSGAEDSASDEE